MSGDGYTRLYASVTGVLLIAVGLFGFMVGSDFRDAELTGSLLGIYAVNGWANSLHVIAGIVALLLAPRASRLWALTGALLFTGLGVWGIVAADGTLLAGVLPAPRTVNLVNLILGVAGLAALLAGPIESRAARASARKRAKRIRSRTRSVDQAASGSPAGTSGSRRGPG